MAQLHNLSGPVLRDTARLSQRYPPIARYGVFGVSTWPIGCDTPPPFSERFPLESMQSGGAIPPPLKRGISAIPARYAMKTRQMGAIPPSAILSRKGIARYGGVSRTGPLSPQLFCGQNILLLQEQRKGGFSKGGFCRVQCHAQGNRNDQGYWAQQYIWH